MKEMLLFNSTKIRIQKILFLILFMIVSCSVLPSMAAEYEINAQNMPDGSIIVSYDLFVDPGLTEVFVDNQSFSHFENLTEFNRSTKEGYPEFLSKQVTLSVDPDLVYSLKIVESEYETYKLDSPYLVGRGTITRNQNPKKIPYRINKKSRRFKKYPKKRVELEKKFSLRNLSGFNFKFNITQFNIKKNSVKLYTHYQFVLTPKLNGAKYKASARKGKVIPEVHKVLRTLFINYEADSVNTMDSVAKSYEVRSSAGDLLVIYTTRDENAIQPYIQHKQSMGLTVQTQKVATGTNVKSIIQNAYNQNPNLFYVQLVGDWSDIKSDLGTSQNAPMDPMLGCVSGNDNYPDLAIGRFSASSASQVTVQVNKTISYEQNSVKPYWNNALGIASSEGPGDDNEIDYAHLDIIKENKLLPNQYSSVGEIYGSGSTSQVSNSVNSGTHLINYTGHGGPTSWGTTGFSSSNVNSLSNGDKLPIIFSVACVVGTFHQGTCFAESWLQKNNGGAVATVMATINQPWTPPMRGQDYMNDLLTGGYNYGSNPGSGTSTTSGKSTFGEIMVNAFSLMYAESSGSSDLDTISTWTTFGDVALLVVDDGQGGGGGDDDCYASNVTLNLATDNYGGEASWNLKNENGTTIDSGSGYSSNSNYTETFMLQAGNYVFTINDSYGDGLTEGNGSYRLTDGNGTQIVIGSDFGSTESTDFCIGGSGGDKSYVLTVNNGSGDGSYTEGATATIQANTAPSGQEFDLWTVTSGDLEIDNVNSSNTTLTMGSGNATVTATYKNLPPVTYALTVNSGSGDGNYEAGATAIIQANTAPSGQVFDHWVVNSGNPQISNVNASSTTLRMGATAATVTAMYTGSGGDCFTSNVTLNLTTDKYGYETSWVLRNSSGAALYSGSGYNSYSNYTATFVLQAGNYVFNIYDSYGDGLTVGNGSYRLTDANGVQIVMGSNFGSSESTDFCISDSGGGGDDCYAGNVTMNLRTDNYGSETSWVLRNANGAALYSGSGYYSYYNYSQTFVLSAGNYVFTIYDTYGDGLTVGNGYYRLTSGKGTEIVMGSNFGSSESTDFCISASGK